MIVKAFVDTNVLIYAYDLQAGSNTSGRGSLSESCGVTDEER